jgi:hypothetical protein
MDLTRYEELLSAYLDRELSPDERAAVDRLLDQSSEARERLRELEATSRFVRSQPRHQLTVGFAESVIDRLRSESLLRPAPIAPQPTRRRNAWWVGAPMAAAATLLIALGIWNYRPGNTTLPALPTPSPSNLADSSISSEPLDQLADLNVVEIHGPGGEKQFELFVLTRTTEPNTLKCILADSQVPEASKSESVAEMNEPAESQSGDRLAIVASHEQLEQLRRLREQSDDQSGGDFPLVEIVTDMALDEIRLARVGSDSRLSGITGDQELFAARGSRRSDDRAELAEGLRSQSLPASTGVPPSEPGTGRRAVEAPGPAVAMGKEKQSVDQPAASSLVAVPVGSGFPLLLPKTGSGETVAHRSEAGLAAKSPAPGSSPTTKSAEGLLDRTRKVPQITQITEQQPVPAAQATDKHAVPSRSAPDRSESLAKGRAPERPGSRPARPDDKEPRVHVLLRFGNRPE